MDYICPQFRLENSCKGESDGYHSDFFRGGLGNGYFYCTNLDGEFTGYGNGYYHYLNSFNRIKFDFNRICT